MRRRELLVAGITLVTGLSGCGASDDLFGEDQQTDPPPLIEVTITNRDFEPYDLQLLIQSNGGEIHSWNKYELRAATESDGVKTAQAVAAGTGKTCLGGFLVSASIDGGDNWSQISEQTYVQEREDASESQGAAPEGEITDGELTFYPRLDNIVDGQCSNATQESDATSSVQDQG